MRITFTVHGYSPSIGGAQSYTRGLAEELARRGHDVHVVAPAVDDPEAFYELGHRRVGPTNEVRSGVHVHRIPLLSWRRRFSRRVAPVLDAEWRAYAERLGSALASIGPDIVVALPHLFPSVLAAAEHAATAPWRLVHVPMLHEHDPNWSVSAVGRIVARADLAVALTDHEADRLREAYGARRVAVVPPGVEVHAGCPGGGADPIVLFLGRPAATKRLDLLVDAMPLVRTRVPDATLVIAGPGPLESGSYVTVDTPGDDERARLVEQARVVVNPSRIESFGLTTLDAWAHRTPVVVADTPVNRSVVRDGRDGLCFDDTVDGLADRIVDLLADPEGAALMGTHGHERAAAEFTWGAAATALEAALG